MVFCVCEFLGDKHYPISMSSLACYDHTQNYEEFCAKKEIGNFGLFLFFCFAEKGTCFFCVHELRMCKFWGEDLHMKKLIKWIRSHIILSMSSSLAYYYDHTQNEDDFVQIGNFGNFLFCRKRNVFCLCT